MQWYFSLVLELEVMVMKTLERAAIRRVAIVGVGVGVEVVVVVEVGVVATMM
jgi:hypothetical protein